MMTKQDDSLEHWVKEYAKAGQDWVKAKLKSDQLDEDAKSYLASLMNGIEAKTSEKISEAKLDRMARGTPEYRKYIIGMCEARAAMLSARVKFDALDKWFEAKRSNLSFEKEVVKKGIFSQGGQYAVTDRQSERR